MKIQAIKTECCNTIKDFDEVHGVIYKADMFEPEKSYVTVEPQKSDKHYCTSCYISRVIESAELVSPKKRDAILYEQQVKIYRYAFMKHLFKEGNWQL